MTWDLRNRIATVGRRVPSYSPNGCPLCDWDYFQYSVTLGHTHTYPGTRFDTDHLFHCFPVKTSTQPVFVSATGPNQNSSLPKDNQSTGISSPEGLKQTSRQRRTSPSTSLTHNHLVSPGCREKSVIMHMNNSSHENCNDNRKSNEPCRKDILIPSSCHNSTGTTKAFMNIIGNKNSNDFIKHDVINSDHNSTKSPETNKTHPSTTLSSPVRINRPNRCRGVFTCTPRPNTSEVAENDLSGRLHYVPTRVNAAATTTKPTCFR